jgi:hypothetical protein
MRKNADPKLWTNESAIAIGIRNIGTSITSSVKKESDLKKIEGKVFAELRDTEEGRRFIAQDLMRLTEMAKQRDASISTKGNPFIFYVKFFNEEDKNTVINFNQKAFEFTKMPYEWGQEKGGKNKKEYEKAKAEYEKARDEILKIKASREGAGDKGRAMLEVLEIDNAIQMEQLLNTHPEFEKALADFGRSAGGKEMVKTAGNFLQTITGGKNLTNKLLIAGGFSARMLARGAVALSGATIITAFAAPVIGGVVGGLRGVLRANKTLDEREKQARHGQKDTTKEKVRMVDVAPLTNGLEKMAHQAEMATSDEERAKILGKLAVVIEYAQEQIEKGQVNFGDAKSALANQFNFVNNLNRALVLKEMNIEKTNMELKKRIDGLIETQGNKIDWKIYQARNTFIKKQAIKGAAMGAGFATLGYGVRWFGEHMGWWGGGQTPTGVRGTVTQPAGGTRVLAESAGGKAPITYDTSEGFIERTKSWMSGHGGFWETEKEKLNHEEMARNLKSILQKDIPKPPPPATSSVIASNLHEDIKINLMVVHKGEGVEHTFIRQIEHNPKLAQELGFKGDIKDAKALRVFAGREAHVVATQTGYVDNAGHEVRVMEADKVAYELKAENGHPIVIEKTIDGKILGIYDDKEGYEFGKNPDNPYEKEINTTQQPIKIPATPPGEIHQTAEPPAAPEPTPPTVEEATATVLKKYPPTKTPEAAIAAGRGAYGGNIQYGTTSSAYGTNTGPGYDINPEGIREHGEHFLGLTPEQNDFLNHHMEFVGKNPFHLTGEKLIETYEVYKENIANIFRDNTEIEIWKDIKDMKASEFLQSKDYKGSNIMNYFHELQEVTKLKPKGGIITRAETTNEYIIRALQKIAKLGKLKQFRP